ncbi:MAG: RimK family protein [bacterium]|jgi:glutathione synthase/RimK-type ligase-like ATP-grasp enzyme
MRKLLVVDQPDHFKLPIEGVGVVSAKAYLTQPEFSQLPNLRVFNLCNDYRYQSKGYYVSLLAEARGHNPIPSVKNLQDLQAPTLFRSVSDDLDTLVQKSLRKLKSEEFTLSIYFGRNLAKQYERLCMELHRLFPMPFLRVRFIKQKKRLHTDSETWTLQQVKAIAFRDIPESHLDLVMEAAQRYFGRKRYQAAKPTQYEYDLAILVNREEKAAPSDAEALEKFAEAATRLKASVTFVDRDDLHRIAEFDALLIRETTNVNHHTYRFARRAQAEGLAVIDDPDSILRCTNKVYLAELLQQGKVPIPKGMVVHSENRQTVGAILGFPCVLKLPDSSFSQGVIKVRDEAELKVHLQKMFAQSELVLAQEYMPTDFDWRIGVLDGKPLFACKYFMARGHWQIYNWGSQDSDGQSGEFETIAVEDAPDYVVRTALKAARLIGNGLYGVDLKEVRGKAYVVEVNDNPNIDHRVEDLILGDEIYRRVLSHLFQQIEQKS